MPIITDFSQASDTGDAFHEMLPLHTMEVLDDYFIKGWQPGGFLSAMVAEDYKKALGCADQANKQRFWYIAIWLIYHAPKGSTGSYKALENWCDNKDGIQLAHKDQAEKDFEWHTLSGERVT